jgi:hypothetical protein
MEPRPRDEPSFDLNAELLLPDLRVPLPVTANSRLLLTETFRIALRAAGAPAELIEPASVTGGGLVHACQEFVRASNRLLVEEASKLADAVRVILWASRDILGAENAAYALHQASEGQGESGREAVEPDFERMKGLMMPLERRLEELGLPERMDPVRFAVIQVRLDEVYDETGRQLQRFYRAIGPSRPKGEFQSFARGLAEVVTREIIPDHLLASHERPGRERTGLIDLLPELEREFI